MSGGPAAHAEAAAHDFKREFASRASSEWGADMETICTEPGNCAMVSEDMVKWLRSRGHEAKTITGTGARNKDWLRHAGVNPGSEDDAHTAVLMGDHVVDITARQFDPKAPPVRVYHVDEFRKQWQDTDR